MEEEKWLEEAFTPMYTELVPTAVLGTTGRRKHMIPPKSWTVLYQLLTHELRVLNRSPVMDIATKIGVDRLTGDDPLTHVQNYLARDAHWKVYVDARSVTNIVTGDKNLYESLTYSPYQTANFYMCVYNAALHVMPRCTTCDATYEVLGTVLEDTTFKLPYVLTYMDVPVHMFGIPAHDKHYRRLASEDIRFRMYTCLAVGTFGGFRISSQSRDEADMALPIARQLIDSYVLNVDVSGNYSSSHICLSAALCMTPTLRIVKSLIAMLKPKPKASESGDSDDVPLMEMARERGPKKIRLPANWKKKYANTVPLPKDIPMAVAITLAAIGNSIRPTRLEVCASAPVRRTVAKVLGPLPDDMSLLTLLPFASVSIPNEVQRWAGRVPFTPSLRNHDGMYSMTDVPKTAMTAAWDALHAIGFRSEASTFPTFADSGQLTLTASTSCKNNSIRVTTLLSALYPIAMDYWNTISSSSDEMTDAIEICHDIQMERNPGAREFGETEHPRNITQLREGHYRHLLDARVLDFAYTMLPSAYPDPHPSVRDFMFKKMGMAPFYKDKGRIPGTPSLFVIWNIWDGLDVQNYTPDINGPTSSDIALAQAAGSSPRLARAVAQYIAAVCAEYAMNNCIWAIQLNSRVTYHSHTMRTVVIIPMYALDANATPAVQYSPVEFGQIFPCSLDAPFVPSKYYAVCTFRDERTRATSQLADGTLPAISGVTNATACTWTVHSYTETKDMMRGGLTAHRAQSYVMIGSSSNHEDRLYNMAYALWTSDIPERIRADTSDSERVARSSTTYRDSNVSIGQFALRMVTAMRMRHDDFSTQFMGRRLNPLVGKLSNDCILPQPRVVSPLRGADRPKLLRAMPGVSPVGMLAPSWHDPDEYGAVMHASYAYPALFIRLMGHMPDPQEASSLRVLCAQIAKCGHCRPSQTSSIVQCHQHGLLASALASTAGRWTEDMCFMLGARYEKAMEACGIVRAIYETESPKETRAALAQAEQDAVKLFGQMPEIQAGVEADSRTFTPAI